jgi:CubicO group peptidase (beta-lactamase class C family)
MKTFFLALYVLSFSFSLSAQLYFPPNNASEWETMDPKTLGWCTTKIDSLYKFLEANGTKAFILLKDGKIVLEKYMNGHSRTSNWYWASAGKTLTATLVGIAQQEKLLDISEPSSKYLGKGWTSCTPAQEDKITIRNQLTMTSGLDDGVADPFCTLSSCLKYKADAGSRWAYHNGPYTLLDQVIEKASNRTMNQYLTQKIKNTTGMDGIFIKQDYNNVYFSTARSMARFGLLILNKGNWNGTQILTDQKYYNDMVNTSQNLNESYGYLWWLNGKSNFLIPGSQIKFPGSLFKNAPADMFSALGKNGQFINVIPSQNMVWIRMGDNPDNSLVPFLYNEDVWDYINDLACTTSISESTATGEIKVYPNPANQLIFVENHSKKSDIVDFYILNTIGEKVISGKENTSNFGINITDLKAGLYFIIIQQKEGNIIRKFIKN